MTWEPLKLILRNYQSISSEKNFTIKTMNDVTLTDNGTAIVGGKEYEVRGFDHAGHEAIVIHELDLISYDEGDNWKELD
jgi:hypothetical protein